MLPLFDCNLVGAQASGATDLGLTALLGVLSTSVAGGVYASTPFSTGPGATVLVLGQTASGTVTVKTAVAADAASISYASGTVNGTFTSASTPQFVANVTTAANPFFGVQLTDSGTTSTFVPQSAGGAGKFTVLVLYGLFPGEGWTNIHAGYKAVTSRVRSNGSGAIGLAPG